MSVSNPGILLNKIFKISLIGIFAVPTAMERTIVARSKSRRDRSMRCHLVFLNKIVHVTLDRDLCGYGKCSGWRISAVSSRPSTNLGPGLDIRFASIL